MAVKGTAAASDVPVPRMADSAWQGVLVNRMFA